MQICKIASAEIGSFVLGRVISPVIIASPPIDTCYTKDDTATGVTTIVTLPTTPNRIFMCTGVILSWAKDSTCDSTGVISITAIANDMQGDATTPGKIRLASGNVSALTASLGLSNVEFNQPIALLPGSAISCGGAGTTFTVGTQSRSSTIKGYYVDI